MIQVVMPPADARLADLPLAAEAGVDTYPTQPFRPATLLDVVRSVLQTARAT